MNRSPRVRKKVLEVMSPVVRVPRATSPSPSKASTPKTTPTPIEIAPLAKTDSDEDKAKPAMPAPMSAEHEAQLKFFTLPKGKKVKNGAAVILMDKELKEFRKHCGELNAKNETLGTQLSTALSAIDELKRMFKANEEPAPKRAPEPDMRTDTTKEAIVADPKGADPKAAAPGAKPEEAVQATVAPVTPVQIEASKEPAVALGAQPTAASPKGKTEVQLHRGYEVEGEYNGPGARKTEVTLTGAAVFPVWHEQALVCANTHPGWVDMLRDPNAKQSNRPGLLMFLQMSIDRSVRAIKIDDDPHEIFQYILDKYKKEGARFSREVITQFHEDTHPKNLVDLNVKISVMIKLYDDLVSGGHQLPDVTTALGNVRSWLPQVKGETGAILLYTGQDHSVEVTTKVALLKVSALLDVAIDFERMERNKAKGQPAVSAPEPYKDAKPRLKESQRKCYNCDNEGHMARDCTQAERPDRRPIKKEAPRAHAAEVLYTIVMIDDTGTTVTIATVTRPVFQEYKDAYPNMLPGDIIKCVERSEIHSEGKLSELILYHGTQRVVFKDVHFVYGEGPWLFNHHLLGYIHVGTGGRPETEFLKFYDRTPTPRIPNMELHGVRGSHLGLHVYEFTAKPSEAKPYEPGEVAKRGPSHYPEAKRGFQDNYRGETSQDVPAADTAKDSRKVNECKLKWHCRLGHTNGVSLGKTSRMTSGMPWLPISAMDCKCEACLENKATTRPHPSIPLEDVAKHAGDRIMVDLIGPIDPTGIDGEKYVVYCIDEYSRYGFVESVKSKAEARKFVMSVIDDMEAHGITVREVHSDNAKELHSLEKALGRKKIKLTHCVAYNHQGDAVVERHNRTLEEGVRTMLNGRHVDQKFWPYAVAAFCDIKNKIFHKSLAERGLTMTPEEAYRGKAPSMDRMHEFGCPVFMKLVGTEAPSRGQKFEPKAVKGFNLGCDTKGSHGWTIYIPEQDNVVVSRDVAFRDDAELDRKAAVGWTDKLVFEDEDTAEPVLMAEYEDVDAVINLVPEPEVTAPHADAEYRGQDGFDSDDSAGEEENREKLEQKEILEKRERSEGDGIEGAPNRAVRRRSMRILLKADKKARRAQRLEDREEQTELFVGMAMLGETVGPKSYKEMLRHPDRELFEQAIQDEHKSMDDNEVWELVPRPVGKHVLWTKWVFGVKDGGRHRARCVAKGYSQIEGEDYTETNSPNVSDATFRIMLVLANQMRLEVDHLDIKTAYLNAELKEEIYIEIPEGIKIEGATAGHVLRLLRPMLVHEGTHVRSGLCGRPAGGWRQRKCEGLQRRNRQETCREGFRQGLEVCWRRDHAHRERDLSESGEPHSEALGATGDD